MDINDTLETLEDALRDFATKYGIEVTDSIRKNIIKIDLGGRVTVSLAYEEEERKGGRIDVDGSEISCDFDSPPSPSALLGLVAGYLGIVKFKGGPMETLGAGLLAAKLGVKTGTFNRWVERNPPDSDHPFPVPDSEIHGQGCLVTRGWKPERIAEVKQWVATRKKSATERFVAELERMDEEEPGVVKRLYDSRKSWFFRLLTDSQKVAVVQYLGGRGE